MRIIFYRILFFSLLALSVNAYAVVGIGGVADALLDPVFVVSDFINAACYIIGVSFIFASIVKYMEHKKSPLMVPISLVVFLLLAGVILVLMPFAGKLLNVLSH